ncbi:Cytochrome P450 [Corchorus olitorius]|uniref:Cytochrome P450 n=1 Tax=Corchorus olitorius TaxID=93759 RepID=A0A1R3HXD2_9ROSI|nr:Cytochrome P450 [Corchorus olitorius]
MPPSASGAWPIIGHLHIFKTQIPAHITLAKMAEKYGPIFTIKLGLSRALIVTLMARKITTVQLLSAARLAKFEDVRQREVAAWMKDIHERWEKNKDGSSNKVMLEMDSLLGDLVLNLMFLMIVGKRYVEYNKKNDDSLTEPMRKFNHFIGGFFISDMFPYLKWLDIDGQEGEMKKTGKAMNDMAEEWLEEHKRKGECGEGNEEKDFMDILLSILQVEKIPEFDADTINKATCLNLIVAAHEATTLAMVWVIAVLVNNQETPFGEPIDMNGRPGITYLKATPLEVLLSPRLPAHLYE